MNDFSLSYREVIPDQTVFDSWKEISLNTGGTQSTLQDIKVAERSNGYCYEDATKHHTRNRFIYWRINNDILELVEHSLDINLNGNRIRYKFVDTPILDGVSIHETIENVVVLVPTVCSIHRLVFPHPDKFHRQDEYLGIHPDLAAPSIFSKAAAIDAKNPNTFHVFNSPHSANDQLPNLASSFLHSDTEEAIFVLAYPSTELLLIKQNSYGQCVTMEMKGESLMPRFLSGFAERFRQKNSDVVSLIIQVLDNDIYALTLCRDGHLKFWSCTKGQCVAVIDILTETGDTNRDLVQGASLRKTVNGYNGDSMLAVFMSFSTGCQFHILKPVLKGQQIEIVRLSTLHSSENDLIDFSLQTNRIWSAWRCEDGECVVYSASLYSNSIQRNQWTPVVLEPLPDPNNCPNLDDEMDPKQVYLEQIFLPGKFPLHIISKALCIYKRSTVMSDSNLSATMLKQRICMAVENEIRNMLNEQEVNDQEYLDCAQWCWQKFYSCCVQYYVAGLKPLGLLLLPSVSGVVFLKKSNFSFLRPLEPLEHMTLCTEFMFKDQFSEFPMLGEDLDTTGDVINLFEVIVYLEQQMSDIFSFTFQKELLTLQPPDIVMSKLLEKIQTEMDSEFTSQVANMLSQCVDLYKAIHKILELLRYENLTPDDGERNPIILQQFSSQLGVSFVAGCLRQQAQTRFSICRNLLLICNILLDRKKLDWGVLEAIRSVCMPEIVVFTQASFVMLWLSGLPALVNPPQESSLERLDPIKLTPVISMRSSNVFSVSLLEMFTASMGGHEARKTFSKIKYHNEDFAHWHLSLLPYLNHLRHIIWPVGGSTVLAEWLLSSGQHLWLQQYVRLLSNWCEWNSCTRSFLLAISYLTSGENYKALELFKTAAKGIFTDKFLEERLLRNMNDDSQIKAYVNYYLKVIQLFEHHKARDCAINIANTALSIVQKDDPLMATLYSIKFKHHLVLKHYEMAFDSLNSNPDAERKKDNLRDLVKTLLDEKKLDILLNFTYGSMDEFFSNILLSRARATDAINNVFYDFLYSYQIKRGPLCHRLAASVMYEQAYRLSQSNTVEALEKQVKCYLAAKNVLQLCDPKHGWVVRPCDPDEEEEEIVLEHKAGISTIEDLRKIKLQKQVEVINIETIQKDLLFACAKLKLVRFNGGSSTNVTTPSELVILLNNAGLFKTALQVCTTFSVNLASVFETLAKHCVLLTEQEHPNAWEWLVENDLQDLPVNNRDCIADVVWQLLQDYLTKYEEPNMTILHYVVCKKIISMRNYIPYWLLASYKTRNPAELLKLLHSTGRLEEAVTLAREYLLAAMGYGKELYGFSTPLTHASEIYCLPVYAMQCLLDELQIQNTKNVDQPYEKEHRDLTEIFAKYLETSTRISNEMCQYSNRIAGK